MSNELYSSLFDTSVPHEGTDKLVAAFAEVGRLRRAAFDLASDEMHEGIWAIEDAAEPQVLRYAADDRDEQTATYSSDGYTVTVRSESQAWTATLDHGTPGASLKIDNEWVTLELGSAVDLPVDALPEALTLIDLTGREISLGRT